MHSVLTVLCFGFQNILVSNVYIHLPFLFVFFKASICWFFPQNPATGGLELSASSWELNVGLSWRNPITWAICLPEYIGRKLESEELQRGIKPRHPACEKWASQSLNRALALFLKMFLHISIQMLRTFVKWIMLECN